MEKLNKIQTAKAYEIIEQHPNDENPMKKLNKIQIVKPFGNVKLERSKRNE